VARLKVALADRIEPMRRYTQNRDSYLEYMNARYQWANRYGGGLLEALRAFERAIGKDKNNALAYSGVADVFAFLGFYSIEMPKEAFGKAAAAAKRALAIDDRLPEVHASLGIVALSKWDWPTAEAELLRATELDRRQALAEMYYSWLLALTNRPDEARDAIDRAQSIDPLGALVNSGAGWLHFLLRDYRQAIKECEQVEKREPGFLIQLYVRGMAHMRHEDRQYDLALPLIEQAATLARRTPFYLGLLGQVYAETGRRDEVDRILAELDGLRAAGRYVPPHCYVYIYASLGDKDRAFAWQERACEDEAPPFYFMSPAIDSLRDDPRHLAHLARMQQTAAARAAAFALGSPPGVVNT